MKKMRWTLCVALAIVLFSAGGMAAVVVALTAREADVTFTEEVFFGDPQAADGLTVRTEVLSGERLFWRTDYTFGAVPEAKSEFMFENTPYNTEYYYVYPRSLVKDTWKECLDGDSQPALAQLYQEMYEEALTKPLGTCKRKIKLIDYASQIPFRTDFSFFEHTAHPGSKEYKESWDYVEDVLLTGLTIDVDPSWEVTVSLTIREQGWDTPYVVSFSGDLPYIRSVCCITEDAFYMALHAEPSDGCIMLDHPVLGLYKIPLDPNKTNAEAVLIDEMTQLCRIDPDHDVTQMEYDATENTLNILLHDREAFELQTFDLETGESCYTTIGEAELRWIDLGFYDHFLTFKEDFAVFRARHQMLVFLRREGKSWRVVCETRAEEHADTPLAWLLAAEDKDVWYVADGDRLGVVTQSSMADCGCGFSIAVFDGQELRYHGRYRSSLDTRLSGGNDCRIMVPEGHRPHWWS